MSRIPQPPVNLALRDAERHDFWLGFVVVLAGLLLAFCGAQHLTSVGTVEGASASEPDLIKAFSFGGLQYASEQAPPKPPKPTGDPAADAAALAKWDQQQAGVRPPDWKVRVDIGAKTPCPT